MAFPMDGEQIQKKDEWWMSRCRPQSIHFVLLPGRSRMLVTQALTPFFRCEITLALVSWMAALPSTRQLAPGWWTISGARPAEPCGLTYVNESVFRGPKALLEFRNIFELLSLPHLKTPGLTERCFESDL